VTIYYGADFHARVQSVSSGEARLGEIHTLDLNQQTDDLHSNSGKQQNGETFATNRRLAVLLLVQRLLLVQPG
jgi:hypothetical protein